MPSEKNAKRGFDPQSGVQDPSTGLLGAVFAFLLRGAYAFYQSNVLPGGARRSGTRSAGSLTASRTACNGRA